MTKIKKDCDNYLKSLDAFVIHFTPKLKSMVGKRKRNLPSNIYEDDLISEATIALIQCYDKIGSFSKEQIDAFVSQKIKFRLIDHLIDEDYLTNIQRRFVNRMKKAEKNLKMNGKELSSDNMALELEMTKEDYLSKKAEIMPISHFSSVAEQDVFEIENDSSLSPHSLDSAEDYYYQHQKQKMMNEGLSKLSAMHLKVYQLLYTDGLKMKEAGKILSLTESRVSQLNKEIETTLSREILKKLG